MIKQILREGFILKSQGYYKHAIEAFYKALEIDNTSSELLLEIADLYRLIGDEERALGYIEQILEKEPTHIECLKFLKNIFVNKKAWAEAEQTAKNIFCISNNLDDLAEVFAFLNKQGRQNEIFEYNLDKFNHIILYEMAQAKFLQNDFVTAEHYINESLKLEQNNKNLLLKGKILFKTERKDDCNDIVSKLVSIDDDDEVLNFIGLIKQYQGDFKNAVSYFMQAIKLAPQRDEYYYNCASTYFKINEIKLAKKYYNLAISINPDNPNYHFALANLYYSEKNYKRAIEELDYDFFEAKLLKSVILFDSGYYAIAKRDFESLLLEQPNNFLIQDYLIKIQECMKI